MYTLHVFQVALPSNMVQFGGVFTLHTPQRLLFKPSRYRWNGIICTQCNSTYGSLAKQDLVSDSRGSSAYAYVDVHVCVSVLEIRPCHISPFQTRHGTVRRSSALIVYICCQLFAAQITTPWWYGIRASSQVRIFFRLQSIIIAII